MDPPWPPKKDQKIDWSKAPVSLPPLTDDCLMPFSKNHVGKPMKTVPIKFFEWMHKDMLAYTMVERSPQWLRVYEYYKTNHLKKK